MRDYPERVALNTGRTTMAWGLLIALLPSLLYLGHWSLRIPLPRTDSYVAVGALEPAHGHGEDGEHGRHCHGDASCSDSPPAPMLSAFALVAEAGLLAAAALTLRPVISIEHVLGPQAVHGPEAPPPRVAGSPA